MWRLAPDGKHDDVLIEPASLADAASILDLQRRAYQSEAQLYDDWSIPPLTQTLAELEQEFATHLILKAMDDGTCIGSVRARRVEATLHIGRLIVAPEHQRRGLGSALLQAAEASDANALDYALFTGSRSAGNIRLYQRHGYRIVREQQISPKLTLVFLHKPRPA